MNSLKGSNTRNLVARMNHRRSFTLRSHQDNVNQIGRRGHGANSLKVVNGHDERFVWRLGSTWQKSLLWKAPVVAMILL